MGKKPVTFARRFVETLRCALVTDARNGIASI
jgi:hypothetical protein